MAAQARRVLTTGTVALALGVGASVGAGSTAAADPIVGGDCSTAVPGFGGKSGLLGSGSILDTGAPLGLVSDLCTDTLGTVGAAAAPVVEPVVEPVQRAAAPVTEAVGVAVQPAAPSAAPEEAAPAEQVPQSAAPEPAAAAALPPAAVNGPFLAAGTPLFASGGSFLFRSTMVSWSPGMLGTVPTGDLFGYLPDFGILGASETAPTAAGDVAAAGRATALPATPERAPVAELLATLAVAGVLVALVRSWAGRVRTRRI